MIDDVHHQIMDRRSRDETDVHPALTAHIPRRIDSHTPEPHPAAAARAGGPTVCPSPRARTVGAVRRRAGTGVSKKGDGVGVGVSRGDEGHDELERPRDGARVGSKLGVAVAPDHAVAEAVDT